MKYFKLAGIKFNCTSNSKYNFYPEKDIFVLFKAFEDFKIKRINRIRFDFNNRTNMCFYVGYLSDMNLLLIRDSVVKFSSSKEYLEKVLLLT